MASVHEYLVRMSAVTECALAGRCTFGSPVLHSDDGWLPLNQAICDLAREALAASPV